MSQYETETFGFGPGEFENGEWEASEWETGEWEGPNQPEFEEELTAELLTVASEQELEEFLGNAFSSIGRAAGNFIRSPTGQALGGMLKNVARAALPAVGGALGSLVAPGVGTALGARLGSMASNLFEINLEAMEQEEAEYEVARRFVRLATAAARNAAAAPPNVPPEVAAQQAIAQAAQRFAPGLLRNGAAPQAESPQGEMPGYFGGFPGRYGSVQQSGRWFRSGNRIVVVGV
jgi:uncharacterized protein (DUF697 family)